MNDIHILMFMVGGGFVLLGIVWVHMNSKFETMQSTIDANFKSVRSEIKSLDEKVTDIDRRLCRIEGSLATQGHCLFNQNIKEKKAE
jgi:hypothetical protein